MLDILARAPGLKLLAASILAILVGLAVLLRYWSLSTPRWRYYTYLGNDYPRRWPLELDRVHKATEDTIHYALDTPLGHSEWDTTLPSGGGILHFGPSQRPFSISMFHQLRCLNVIGRELEVRANGDAAWKEPTPLSTHCMSYMRQMVLCRASTRLESVHTSTRPHVSVNAVTHTCNDWSAVYEAAERNSQTHEATK
ncbi:hypothetical protein EXIGLDRAFT_775275 [Exidia glandulosa HHB12029]|uniref:Uncharacterized protein n=1 Tax=Exidia glandulosa HHB12029 TaxID=1314781 RepID=A0A165DZC9_EXIGL|nr:hypothetical protein EXIGLDRAFT_775275 [Exidia glandulosa HHB12029]